MNREKLHRVTIANDKYALMAFECCNTFWHCQRYKLFLNTTKKQIVSVYIISNCFHTVGSWSDCTCYCSNHFRGFTTCNYNNSSIWVADACRLLFFFQKLASQHFPFGPMFCLCIRFWKGVVALCTIDFPEEILNVVGSLFLGFVDQSQNKKLVLFICSLTVLYSYSC